ncbi:MAG: gliding motility-associated ABC transporter substrate-binding protein GldG [Flavobacteriales bacterium]|nr:gliding motility-associated ABC transporter substrate-binding protein GldG [Flavobacteriales bacterium]|tara:strand:- start:1507 stop:3243 length:1737 start_codon:yes stop_codon:yes gene_type:complete
MAIKKQTYGRLALNICILILVNVLASMLFFRIDLTTDKRHSLSDTSKDILQELDDIVYVKVYLEGEFPAGFTRLQNATHQLLNEFRSYSSFLEYEFINPSENTNQEERNNLYRQLYEQGLEPTNLQVQEKNGSSEQIIFPGAIIYYKGVNVSLNLLQGQFGTHHEVVLNNSIANLEYEFSNAFLKLFEQRKPRIAFIEGNEELSIAETIDITNSLGVEKGSLSEYYQVERFDIKEFTIDSVTQKASIQKQLETMTLFQAIIIAKPNTPFNNLDKFLIDQYIMQGGKVLWFIDGVAMDMDSLNNGNAFSMALPLQLNIDDMLFKYGVRVNADLVMDMQSDEIPVVTGYQGDRPQQGMFPWFYNPLVIPKNTHPISKNLDALRTTFVSTIDTVNTNSIKKTPLLFTSPYTKLVKSPHRVSLNILEREPKLDQYKAGEQMIAVMLEGKFSSVFENRINPINKKIPLLSKSEETKMIVVADGDIIKNHVSKSGNAYPLGYNPYNNQQYNGNKKFIINALNYLLGKEELLLIRSRELKLRLLDKNELANNRFFWQIINILTPLLFIAILGLVWTMNRKRKFST